MSFHRDRPTLYSYSTVAGHVWTMYAMGPVLLLLRDERGLSRGMSSLHSTAFAIGVILIGIIGARTQDALGRSRSITTGSVFVGLGGLGLVLLQPPALTLLCAFAMGIGGSTILNAVNAFLALHHHESSAAALSESQGIGIAAGLLSPMALGAAVDAGVNWRWVMVVAPLLFLGGRLLRGDHTAIDQDAPHHPDAPSRLPRLYWWAWTVFAFCIATEFAFMLWAGDILREQAHASTGLAAGALSAVAIGMAVARFTTSALLTRFSSEGLFRFALLLPILAWVPMWLSTTSFVMLGSMIIIGFGIGLHFPLGVSRMLAAAPGLTDTASARSSLAAGIAAAVSPVLLGALGDAVGVHMAFVLVPLYLAIALAATVTHPIGSGR